nr:hypothetical protein [Tanacetum cinerariifolium]
MFRARAAASVERLSLTKRSSSARKVASYRSRFVGGAFSIGRFWWVTGQHGVNRTARARASDYARQPTATLRVQVPPKRAASGWARATSKPSPTSQSVGAEELVKRLVGWEAVDAEADTGTVKKQRQRRRVVNLLPRVFVPFDFPGSASQRSLAGPVRRPSPHTDQFSPFFNCYRWSPITARSGYAWGKRMAGRSNAPVGSPLGRGGGGWLAVGKARQRAEKRSGRELLRLRCKLHLVVLQHGMHLIGQLIKHAPQKFGGHHPFGPWVQFGKSHFAGAVDGHEEVLAAVRFPKSSASSYQGDPAKKVSSPAARRQAAQGLALRALSGRHPGWGFWKLHHRLRKNGLVINSRRTLRIYRALALNLPRRLKKRLPARVKQPVAVPEAANKCWSLDFTSDVLTDGRRFRTLNVLDEYNRELLGVEIDFSLPASRVVQVLMRLVECQGRPAQLRTDNGPEFSSANLSEWCAQQGSILHWIQPGKPTQNAYLERFNGSFRRELLDAHLFRSLAQVRQLVDEWRHDYNTQRPHQALNFMTPSNLNKRLNLCLPLAYRTGKRTEEVHPTTSADAAAQAAAWEKYQEELEHFKRETLSALETRKSSEQEYDKLIVYLAGGGLVLTIGFVKDLMQLTKSAYIGWLLACWLFFALCLLTNLFSHYLAKQAFDSYLREEAGQLQLRKRRRLNHFLPTDDTAGMVIINLAPGVEGLTGLTVPPTAITRPLPPAAPQLPAADSGVSPSPTTNGLLRLWRPPLPLPAKKNSRCLPMPLSTVRQLYLLPLTSENLRRATAVLNALSITYELLPEATGHHSTTTHLSVEAPAIPVVHHYDFSAKRAELWNQAHKLVQRPSHATVRGWVSGEDLPAIYPPAFFAQAAERELALAAAELLFCQYEKAVYSKSVQDGEINTSLATETIRQTIRDNHLRNSSVTVVLVGQQTWKRKHVDWEISSSIRNTLYNKRSGLVGLRLPSRPDYGPYLSPDYGTMPARLVDNLECGYASLYDWTEDVSQMTAIIHEAWLRRNGPIAPKQSRELMSYNADSGFNFSPEISRLNGIRLNTIRPQATSGPANTGDVFAQRCTKLRGDLLNELTRLMLPSAATQPTATQPAPPVKLFLSHARNDGADIAAAVRQHIRATTSLDSFFDVTNIAFGYDFAEAIETNVEASALIVFQTDLYASRDWCQMEALTAKRHKCPIVVVNALEKGEKRSFPYLGNVPTVRWTEGAEANVLAAAMDQVLKNLYTTCLLKKIAALYGHPERYVLASPPELLDFVEIRRAMKEQAEEDCVVMYPDPPLGNREIILLTDSDARLPELAELGFSTAHQQDASVEFARFLLANGASLHYGGDLRQGGYTELFFSLANYYSSPQQAQPLVHSYLAWPLHLDLTTKMRADFKRRVAFHAIELPAELALAPSEFLPPTTAANRYAWARSLTKMREQMEQVIHARILIGGAETKYAGALPGLLEEGLLALRNDKPTYLIGAFGGATRGIIEGLRAADSTRIADLPSQLNSLSQEVISYYNGRHAGEQEELNFDHMQRFLAAYGLDRLAANNGLSVAENERLFVTPHLMEMINLVLTGLVRIKFKSSPGN